MQSLVDGFLIDRQAQGVTPKTLIHHKTSISKFCTFLERLGNPALDSWTTRTLREFVIYLQTLEVRGHRLSPDTVRTYCNSVWAFVRWLYEEELLETNLAEKVKKPRLPKTEKVAFTKEEVKALISAAGSTTNGLRDSAIIHVLLDCGLRSQELCNLTVGDFYASEQLLQVKLGKGQKDRIVPISISTTKMINKYLLKVRGVSLPRNEPLFISKGRAHLTTNGVGLLVKRIALAANVEKANPHKFRHTSALFFLRNGGDPLTLQRVLGHSSLEMTNHYVNMLSEDISRVHALASPIENLK